MRLARDTLNEPRVGIGTVQDSTVVHVTEVVPGSSAEAAGVQVGDILLAVGGLSAMDPAWSPTFRLKYARSPEGTPLPIVVRRNGREQTLQGRLRFVARIESRLTEDPRASAKARRVRDGILRGVTSTR
jgi:C-terminal processing protease CtpA/Prc